VKLFIFATRLKKGGLVFRGRGGGKKGVKVEDRFGG
jgi:hypothetical protein